MNRSMPGLPVHHQLPEFTQTHVHQVGDAIQPSHHLSSPSPPAPNPSQHQGLFQCQLFAQGGQSIGSFSFSISPSSDHSGLISLRMDWLDLLAVQGTLKRSGAAAERSNAMSKEWWLCRRRRAERSYSTFKVSRGGREEIPHVQGKRNPSKMVGTERGHQRADRLKP